VQGIFRLSGGAESVRNLKKAFDTSTHQQSTFFLQRFPVPSFLVVAHRLFITGKDLWNVALPDFTSSGPHAVASLLKLYRSLPPT
jgi:hypothetical protein